MKNFKYLLFLLPIAVVTVFFIWYGPIPQDPAYHHFADQRVIAGIPNFFNVTSNIFFLLIGSYGLYFVFKQKTDYQTFLNPAEKIFYICFFAGLVFVGFGSAYYHLAPTNKTLVWDRLGISIAFMSLFSAMIAERINLRAGLWLLFPLIFVGISSVGYWIYSESIGQSDLRFYVAVQFLPLLSMPFILILFPRPYNKSTYIWLALISYTTGAFVEHHDHEIYRQLHETISGHTLKHLLDALSSYFILHYLKSREPSIFQSSRIK
ncbi:hypothetical protein CbuD7D7780_08065 [Coxiella burnetii]|uniref:Hypothetical membrane spanning protein n=1 Tax=Coxiella burnetii (strain Dugway 5J108-111) TaxID=434922 RepID=A9KCV4_COXBN|nr:ceramidase domain-containing protein [Coxiella burnetii]ABS78412.1 hypothetical membrane spanning protein [Coxiella burnetii Dugway 5J108-111]OYK79857.1 hypothetical protein CbuD7E6568_08045 [Coxiella burnetii]OYK81939.1 hypothetical protein CbuD7D7780_08065 [Coxiella burnetii]